MAAELRVEGQVLEGFLRGRVQLSIADAFSAFEVEYLGEGRDQLERMIFCGDACELVLNGETLVAGYVDTVEDSDEPDGLTLRATGRARTADLADCSSLRAPGSWRKATLRDIAIDVAAPFNIPVFLDGDPGPAFAAFSVQKGESALDTIARAAVKRGFIVYTVGGDLVLARAGSAETTTVLERGVNLVRASRTDSHYARYSDYVLRAQARPTEAQWGKDASQLKYSVQDPGIRRYRPLLVHAEAHSGIDLLQQATLELNQRAGRSERITCTYDGHETDEGYLWRPNILTAFRSRTLGVHATLLVESVRFEFDADAPGETELSLVRPEAYSLDPYLTHSRGEEWT